jgi:membrane associated rhomboid family serine protease
MKAIKIMGHPLVLSFIFLFLLIEGDHFGGFYLLYLLLALPHGALYAILAVFGVIAVVLGSSKVMSKVVGLLLSLSGLISMLVSLLIFFSPGNKFDTFRLTIPLLTFIVFAISIICYLFRLFRTIGNLNNKSHSTLGTTM